MRARCQEEEYASNQLVQKKRKEVLIKEDKKQCQNLSTCSYALDSGISASNSLFISKRRSVAMLPIM